MVKALTLQPKTAALVEHLLAQGAARAASRLAAVELTEDASSRTAAPFVVPPERIRAVESAASASEFAAMSQELIASGNGALALDAEWRPDVGLSRPLPSLVQVATAAAADGEELPAEACAVWLVDIERLRADPAALRLALEALDAALTSDDVRVLGFGLQSDLDKLAMLGAAVNSSWWSSSEDGTTGHGTNGVDGSSQSSSATVTIGTNGAAPFLSSASRVLDLREVAAAAEASSVASGGGRGGAGLAARLARWAGHTLDKSCQRSDWALRPLTGAQLAYAAADAASLLAPNPNPSTE